MKVRLTFSEQEKDELRFEKKTNKRNKIKNHIQNSKNRFKKKEIIKNKLIKNSQILTIS